MSTLKLFFLGPAKFCRDGRVLDFTIAKATALLAYLAINRSPQRRDHLIDLLWPNSEGEAARKNLRNRLWEIHQTFGDGVLTLEDDYIGLGDNIWVDVQVFEDIDLSAAGITLGYLEEMITLYRAPLLDNLNFKGSASFEIWLSAQRQRFGQYYLDGLTTLIEAHVETKAWPAVIPLAQKALACDNLQERMYQVLMEAYAHLGRRSEALQQYQQLRLVFANEFGSEPLPETESLRHLILNGHLQPRINPTWGVTTPQFEPAGMPPYPSAWPFIGRQAECRTLDRSLQRAIATRQPQVVLLAGELGIGKTRLWQQWSRSHHDLENILETRCLDTTQPIPFLPLIRLFNQPNFIEFLFTPPSPVSPIWLTELARFFPDLPHNQTDLPASTNFPPEEERHRLFEAFVQVIQALGPRPIVLFIDDLHWADQVTLDWLMYLVDRLQETALLLVGAYRPTDTSPQLRRLIANWNRESVSQHLPLSPLTLSEARQLITTAKRDTVRVAELYQKSAGNPYFLIELSQVASASIPAKLTDLLRDRLQRLPAGTGQVLQAAAILEPDIEFASLSQVSSQAENQVLVALDQLLRAGILRESDDDYEFAHPLVAIIVRRDLNQTLRKVLSHRAAKTLEAKYQPHLAPVAGQLTVYFKQAGLPAKAAHYAELAAQHALALSAPSEAVTFYQQALSLEPNFQRRLGLGEALFAQGDLEGARETYRQVVSNLAGTENHLDLARAYLTLAESYVYSSQGDMVIYWAEKVLSNFAIAQLEAELAARAYFLMGTGLDQRGHSRAKAERYLSQAIELATKNGLLEIAVRSQFSLGILLAEWGDLPQALLAFQETITLAQQINDYFLKALGHNNLAHHALLLGDLALARQQIEIGLSLVEVQSLFLPRQYLYSTRGELALAEGALAEAERWFRQALTEAEKNDNLILTANIQANLGLVAREWGDVETALRLLLQADQALADVSALYLKTKIDLWLAELYLRRDEKVMAEAALGRAEARLEMSKNNYLKDWAKQMRRTLALDKIKIPSHAYLYV